MNVWEATRERLAVAFDDFDNVVVSFSGGKDSGVMLNAVAEYAREHGHRFAVYHLDYEGQYTETTKYVERALEQVRDVADVYWCCLPVAAQCAVNMSQEHWTPWHPDEQHLWVRDLPADAITADSHPFDFEFEGVWDYRFNELFLRWHHRSSGAVRTINLVGIREQESLHRYAAIHSKTRMWDEHKWTTEISDGIFNGYPIHDWLTEDVWTANARFGWDYNRLYDLMHLAGLTLHEMRVASPFNSYAQDSLKLYRVIDPEMWAKLVGRVNGANFTAIYGGTRAMGWRDVKLPPGHTWKTYCEFLLTTLPEGLRERYLKKFATSIRYWTDSGGALRTELVDELKALGVEFESLGPPTDARRRSQPHKVIRFPEYPDDLEITEYAEVPTYKRMCVTILKNDYACRTMGFGQTKLELAQRREAIKKWSNLI